MKKSEFNIHIEVRATKTKWKKEEDTFACDVFVLTLDTNNMNAASVSKALGECIVASFGKYSKGILNGSLRGYKQRELKGGDVNEKVM